MFSGVDDTPYCLQLFYASNGGYCCLKLVYSNDSETFYCGEDPTWYNPFYNTTAWKDYAYVICSKAIGIGVSFILALLWLNIN